MTSSRLMIVGNPEQEHVGAHLLSAARQMGVAAALLDVREAYGGNLWLKRFFYHVFRRRPARLNRFSRKVVTVCRESMPEILLVTGILPPHEHALGEIGRMGIHRANFLTDDPWNRRVAAGFFRPALRRYDMVWSPRRANLDDLRAHGCPKVEHLPFGYNPALHFPEEPASLDEKKRFACDVAFVGGADVDRLPLARALIGAGLKVNLYGGYWGQDAQLRRNWRGFVLGRELRLAVGGATVNLCMGRKANRDGHAMRSLELPAMRACLVVEATLEHRELFGDEGDCVLYYSTPAEAVDKAQRLCQNPERARALGQKAMTRICQQSKNSYQDRLGHILDRVSAISRR
jgi:hypothetical protein